MIEKFDEEEEVVEYYTRWFYFFLRKAEARSCCCWLSSSHFIVDVDHHTTHGCCRSSYLSQHAITWRSTYMSHILLLLNYIQIHRQFCELWRILAQLHIAAVSEYLEKRQTVKANEKQRRTIKFSLHSIYLLFVSENIRLECALINTISNFHSHSMHFISIAHCKQWNCDDFCALCFECFHSFVSKLGNFIALQRILSSAIFRSLRRNSILFPSHHIHPRSVSPTTPAAVKFFQDFFHHRNSLYCRPIVPNIRKKNSTLLQFLYFSSTVSMKSSQTQLNNKFSLSFLLLLLLLRRCDRWRKSKSYK